ncbi:MAG TPA: ParB N-terminal domain-containing protein, partial [Candidatus Competibacteraceae bacterium]|nr:ParB N-terminal domain-containing protein [Candidatus Competibacteraceae bacterium]
MAKRARDTLDFLTVLAEETSTAVTETPVDRLLELPLESITRSPHQMRRKFDATELAELADSIRTQGVLQPIVIRPQPSGS